MRRAVTSLVIGALIGGILAFAPPWPTAEASGPITCWTRNDARSYTYTAKTEAYKWGGGWWNNNNAWDSGEGPDCSGLTFKTWAMHSTKGNTSRYYWDIGHNVHGPYNSTSFRDGCNGACVDVCGSGTGAACGSNSYSATVAMDGFANDGHVSLIYTEKTNGDDEFINALGAAYGVVQNTTNYRMQPAFDGMRRHYWSGGTSCGPDPQ